MSFPTSAADQRGLDWFLRWGALGCSLTSDDKGNLVLLAPRTGPTAEDAREILQMRAAIQTDPMLAHAVGRAFLDYLRWEDANAV